MALQNKLTTSIKQTSDSCLMISYSIILNYYSQLTGNEIFKFFLDERDELFKIYKIDKSELVGLSLEYQYVYLLNKVGQKENINNEYIANSLKFLNERFQIETYIVDIKKCEEELRHILMTEEACLSLSCYCPNEKNDLQWHTTPIGYNIEFHTIKNGEIILLGQDFRNIKQVFNATDIGDGILFRKVIN